MIETKITINNEAGIHCRPSTAIMTAVKEFPNCEFLLTTQNGESSLLSILELLSLCVQYKEEVKLMVTGDNEEEASKKISDLFAYKFDFPPQQ